MRIYGLRVPILWLNYTIGSLIRKLRLRNDKIRSENTKLLADRHCLDLLFYIFFVSCGFEPFDVFICIIFLSLFLKNVKMSSRLIFLRKESKCAGPSAFEGQNFPCLELRGTIGPKILFQAFHIPKSSIVFF